MDQTIPIENLKLQKRNKFVRNESTNIFGKSKATTSGWTSH